MGADISSNEPEDLLIMRCQQRDHQRRATVGEIGCPTHLAPLRDLEDPSHDIEQITFLIRDLLRHQDFARGIDKYEVMRSLAGVDAGR